jgi:hypothetical protein
MLTTGEAAAVGQKGGKVTQARGTGRRFIVKEARAAGRKGGRARKRNRLERPPREE